ncbi:hypothetical protein ACHAWF_004382, partial [Thalassiosira exigua]
RRCAPVSNVKKAIKPLTIHLPNGDTIQSTHTCLLKRPDLPRAVRVAHIVPGLSHSSLVSVKVLCDAGCEVTYEGDKCNVTYKNKQIWAGVREPTAGLWVLPLTPNATLGSPTAETLPHETVNNVYQMTSKEALVRFFHQCLFSPPKQMLLKALENEQLPTWPLTKEFLEDEDIGLQLVEPHNHRVNAAKRAMQTFKNLFIGGISVCDEEFPTILWSRIVRQCQDACNLLRTSHVHPKVSAYHVLEGVHDFNKVPWVPPESG